MNVKYPGTPTVIHGNGAVAEVMGNVCGGVIGYPITPSTEIAELYEAFRAQGGVNVWGKHPFFFEPEGEHSAQSGALGAALTGGKYISNASSSQGILYGIESHYVTVGKRVGGFVLQCAARVVSKHSLNVMAGHDDVYALLQSGYTILFGSNPQEAADLAVISYKVSANSLIPVTNTMDGFTTSHMLSETLMPEKELIKEFLGDPQDRIPCPTVAQEMLFGAKGRVWQVKQYLAKHEADFAVDGYKSLVAFLDKNADAIEKDNDGKLVSKVLEFVPEELQAQFKRQWVNAYEKGTRQRVPSLVDIHNPGLTGAVQNQPDFQAGSADHRTHFVRDVPKFVREAMAEYTKLTGREYAPIKTYFCEDAENVMVGLGSGTDDALAVAKYLRSQGKKVGVISVKLLQPFPEAEIVAALKGKKAVTILERSDVTALTTFVTQAMFKGVENAAGPRHEGIPAIDKLPKFTTAIFGLGAHDVQPRHLIAAFKNMETKNAPFIYLGSNFFSKNPTPRIAALQEKLKAAYPETELMQLETEANPNLLPPGAFRIRFHSVGGYGTMATGKLLTDILASVLELHSKAAPKYGSEKSGAPTNYYITLSPETVLQSNAEIEDVEIVVSPDHKVFAHSNPLRGIVEGGTFILQSEHSPLEVWAELPAAARKTIRDKKIKFFVIDGFKVAKPHAPTPELETRMMGIAFIGAVCGHVDRIVADASEEAMLEKIRKDLQKKFGAKGAAVVEGNLTVIKEAFEATQKVDYTKPEFLEAEKAPVQVSTKTNAISASLCKANRPAASSNFLDHEYFEDMVAKPFRDGTIGEAPVLPGTGMFLPAGSAAAKDKGLFRREVPLFNAELCTGCMECTLVCPDAAIPNTVHDIRDLLNTAVRQLDLAPAQIDAIKEQIPALSDAVRETYRQAKGSPALHDVVAQAVEALGTDNAILKKNLGKLATALSVFPVARTRPFFDAMEKTSPGAGGLYSVSIDPWKCSGCQECVEVCGPNALVTKHQDEALLENLQTRFEFLSRTPNTPARFTESATKPDGEIKRLMLDRNNYYATTGGHGGCRGCGEVTAIRLVTSTNRAIQERRRKEHTKEVEAILAKLTAKLASVDEPARAARIEKTIKTLEKRLFNLESGPTGNGPASTVIANATGCSSVYASTFPFNPYNDPWVNSLFQDTPAVAKGIFEGIAQEATTDVIALRTAKLELEDEYDPQVHDKFFRTFGWNQFTTEELNLLPTIVSMGGDGATYDIGFGALSRVLATSTPIKVVVLNTGVYSNTGGQASTSSLTGQDSDLSRFGAAHAGKQEDRKDLGLIAAFHPNVFVVQTATAMQGHFLHAVMEYLNHNDGPSLLDVYTPCQAEHGIADAAASEHARMAVEARISPVFIHDPRKGADLHARFSIDGNPEPTKDWATFTLEYVENGETKLLDLPYTPADFARTETRFKKQFRKLAANLTAVPVVEYIDLPVSERSAVVPFVYAVNDKKELVKMEVSQTVIHLVEERRKYWRTMQYLAGVNVQKLDAGHKVELEALQARYKAAVDDRENAIDSIARAMSELAASSKAPAAGGVGFALNGGGAPAAAAAVAEAPANGAVVAMDEDVSKCTNCKTCYTELPELFEKTKLVVDGSTKEVAHLIPGAATKVAPSAELKTKLARIAANCDAEIIHEQ
ncbi:pyruvate-ferredoxin/flavodoxin oxidoreductase [Rhizomicrobium palustre]|uniref:Pyruvate-ferredoxin/flavodoxin oxidoreductase n=1 Tax=Rhizomicrobium palustre TaxID=189966 RepID=A0A846MYY8_9PROT|nr:2-oxoacid:acceptor oxidoreductase family protein [Rhizomicrobium palustre]NIK88459.1 pyruvate-ferredoxin/flavodoxin oxidoreductase [Rhizomicrobium palustre]